MRIGLPNILISYFVICFNSQIAKADKIFEIKNSWDTGFQGEINIPVKETTNFGWTLKIKFHEPIETLECWAGELSATEFGASGTQYTYINFPYNKVLKAGSTFKVEFNGAFIGKSGPKVPPVTVKFENEIIHSDQFTIDNDPVTVSTTDIIYILNRLTDSSTIPWPSTASTKIIKDTGGSRSSINKNADLINEINNRNNNEVKNKNNEINNGDKNQKNRNTDDEKGAVKSEKDSDDVNEEGSGIDTPLFTTAEPTGPRRARRTKYKYAVVLHKSLLFYEAQRSGKLPANNRIPWRGDSALADVGKDGEDLSGGYYDAGDHIKFGFPMAFSLTTLAWGVIEYWEAYQQAGELKNAMSCLKWGADYILKAHVGRNQFYGQVGIGEKDHKYWGRPEDMWMERPAFKITSTNPGSDLAAESSAALSAISLAFERYAQIPYAIPAYVKKLRDNAEALYKFATTYQGKYHKAIKEAKKYYESTDFKDEITWAAAWLYRATGDPKHLLDAEGKFQNLGQFNLPVEYKFSWDDKTAGIQVLLGQVTTGPKSRYYIERANALCKDIRDKKSRYTRKGLLYMDEWSPLRYSANIALICLMVADQGIDYKWNFMFAQNQIHYMLGDTGRSYVVGFGRKYPKQPHHRASSCPAKRNDCSWGSYNSQEPNPHILEGALVGGPNKKDVFSDIRKNYKNTEVTLDHNSCFQGAVAGLLQSSLLDIPRPNNRSHEPWFANVIKTTTPLPSSTIPGSGAVEQTLVRKQWNYLLLIYKIIPAAILFILR